MKVLGETVLKSTRATNNAIDVSNVNSGLYILPINSGIVHNNLNF